MKATVLFHDKPCDMLLCKFEVHESGWEEIWDNILLPASIFTAPLDQVYVGKTFTVPTFRPTQPYAVERQTPYRRITRNEA